MLTSYLQNIVVYCNFNRFVTPNPPRAGFVSYISAQFVHPFVLDSRFARLVIGVIHSHFTFCDSNWTLKELR